MTPLIMLGIVVVTLGAIFVAPFVSYVPSPARVARGTRRRLRKLYRAYTYRGQRRLADRRPWRGADQQWASMLHVFNTSPAGPTGEAAPDESTSTPMDDDEPTPTLVGLQR
jgi:hypothetical protein